MGTFGEPPSCRLCFRRKTPFWRVRQLCAKIYVPISFSSCFDARGH